MSIDNLTEEERYQLKINIAQEVLANLDKLNFKSFTGYVIGFLPEDLVKDNIQLQDHIDEVEEGCTVCLLGGCVLALAKLKNDFPVSNLLNEDKYFNAFRPETNINLSAETANKYLGKVFSLLELASMECAFEASWSAGYFAEKILQEANVSNYQNILAYLKKSAIFAKDLLPKQRVEKVMKNLIEWEGEFNPCDVLTKVVE